MSFSTPRHDPQVVKALFDAQPLAAHGVSLFYAYGFTLSVVSAPELVQPSAYLPLLFKSAALPEFASDEEAEKVMSGMLSLWTYWADQLRGKRRFKLPPECRLDGRGAPEPALIDFCTGYLIGSDWLQQRWDAALKPYGEESEESGMIGTAMLLCLAICRPDALQNDPTVSIGPGEPITPAAALDRLPAALMDVAQLGGKLYRDAVRREQR